jgi:hypothetical protein
MDITGVCFEFYSATFEGVREKSVSLLAFWTNHTLLSSLTIFDFSVIQNKYTVVH